MYYVYWNVGQGWEKLYGHNDLDKAKAWATSHISYTEHRSMRVEIRDHGNYYDIIFDKNWQEN